MTATASPATDERVGRMEQPQARRGRFSNVPIALAILLLAGCAEVQTYGAAVAEQRRLMNDLQATATIAQVCDLSMGSVSRRPVPEQEWLRSNPECPLPTGTQLIMLQTPPSVRP